jgi:hypothetical protein
VDHDRIPPRRVSLRELSESMCCSSIRPMATSAASYMVDLLQDIEGRLPKSHWSPQIDHEKPTGQCLGLSCDE